MRKFTGRDLKALALLSIVVPVGLLITFRLTGILPEPEGPVTIAETTTLDVVKWEFERPTCLVAIRDVIGTTYSGEVSVGLGIYIGFYDPSGDFGSPQLHLGANGTAVTQKGLIKNVQITIREDYNSSFINWFQEGSWKTWGGQDLIKNLSIAESFDWRDTRLKGNMKAFISLAGINFPSSISFLAPIEWFLKSPNNQTHNLEIVTELTYFNGTVYKKIVQPFQLRIGPDDNDSFETADEITLGSHKAYVDEDYDPVDYYNIWLEQGQTIQVESPDGVLNIYVYDSNRELVAESIYGLHEPRQIVFTVNSTGYWYIKTERHHGAVVYTFNLTLLPP